MSAPTVRCFEVRCALFPEWPPSLINTASRGMAKADYWRRVSDAWEGVPYTSMRARAVGPPHTSEDFARCAHRRGRDGVRCGDPVRVGASRGVIVGHNSSANWNVLFHEGEYAGFTLNVHPESCEYEARP